MHTGWLQRIRSARPLIECLTNDVTVNDVANAILAIGASPVMGVASAEIPQLITAAHAVVLNIGTLTETQETVFELALQSAAKTATPVVFDPVGSGATAYRTDFCLRMLAEYPVSLIRGNASEIASLLGESRSTVGVDAAAEDAITDSTLSAHAAIVAAVASKYNCTVSMSGGIDIIGDARSLLACRNGVPWMSAVTGTGCSLTGISAAFIAVSSPQEHTEAAATAVALMGAAGECAFERTHDIGIASFRVALVDALSMMSDQKLDTLSNLSSITLL